MLGAGASCSRWAPLDTFGAMDPADLQCPGRLCMVEYGDEPGTWHDRLIIREASSTMFQVVNGEPPEEEDARMFWCRTPDGDL